MPLYNLGPGAILGDLNSLFEDPGPSRVTVRAITTLQLAQMGYVEIKKSLSGLHPDLTSCLLSMNSRLIQLNENLALASAGADLSQDVLSIEGYSFFIPEFGDDKAHIIIDGNAAVMFRTDSGYVNIASLKTGDVVGRTPFMPISHEPENAAVLVSKNFLPRRIDMKEMEKEYENAPPIVHSTARHLSGCVSLATESIKNLI